MKEAYVCDCECANAAVERCAQEIENMEGCLILSAHAITEVASYLRELKNIHEQEKKRHD